MNVRETRRHKAGRWLAIYVSGLRIRERHRGLDRGAFRWPKPAREKIEERGQRRDANAERARRAVSDRERGGSEFVVRLPLATFALA